MDSFILWQRHVLLIEFMWSSYFPASLCPGRTMWPIWPVVCELKLYVAFWNETLKSWWVTFQLFFLAMVTWKPCVPDGIAVRHRQLGSDATLETDSTHGQMSCEDGVLYRGHPRQMSLCTCTPFWMPNVVVEEKKRGNFHFWAPTMCKL